MTSYSNFNVTLDATLPKPRKTAVKFEAALDWEPGEHFLTRKYDGRYLARGLDLNGHIFYAEEMGVNRRSGARWTATDVETARKALRAGMDRWFAVYDLAAVDGESVVELNTRARWEILVGLSLHFPVNVVLADFGEGGDFVAAVDAAGGEGVCARHWHLPAGGEFLAAKRLEVFRCVVGGILNGKQAVSLIDQATGLPCGHVALFGGKCDRVRPGSVLKVEGLGATRQGTIREPRLCADTPDSWLIRY